MRGRERTRYGKRENEGYRERGTGEESRVEQRRGKEVGITKRGKGK